MKRVNQILIMLFFASVLCETTNAQVAYDYPIKPGTDEWKKFTSTSEMIEACQIPENIIRGLSTADLLNACLKYPLLNNYTASNSLNNGLVAIISTSNALTEFMNRPDSHKVLFNYYKEESVSKIDDSKDKGGYTFDFCAVELLLSQPKLLSRFNDDEQMQVLNTIMMKYNDKSKYVEHFGFIGKMTTAFVANRYAESIGKKTDYSNNNIEKFTKDMILADLNIVDQTISEVSNYIKNKK